MLDYSQPQKLQNAVDNLSEKTPLGTALRSAEIEKLPNEIKRRAFFTAGIENMRLLEEMKRTLLVRLNRERRLGGEGTFQRRDQFLVEMQQLAEKLGLRPTDEKRGTIQDIGSFRRLRLIWDTQVKMAQSFVRWKMGMTKGALFSAPAQELVRESSRMVPRIWYERWIAAGGPLPEGRLVALKTDPIWEKISRFGNPYPPFDFNSGMGVKDVRRREAVSLGLLKKDEVIEPMDVNFNDAAIASSAGISKRGKQLLENMFRGSVNVSDEKNLYSMRGDQPTYHPNNKILGGKFLQDKEPSGIDFRGKIINDVKDPEVFEVVAEITDLVASVHLDGPMKVAYFRDVHQLGINYAGTQSLFKNSAGEYYASDIIISKDSRPEMKRVVLEEFAHHLDDFAFGSTGATRNVASSAEGAISKIVDVLLESSQINFIISSILSATDKIWLIDRAEVFARFYIQFIAEETRDKDLLFLINGFNNSASNFQRHQFWDTAEIIELKQSFARELQRLGWLRDKPQPLQSL